MYISRLTLWSHTKLGQRDAGSYMQYMMPVMISALYKKNLFYQQLSFKWNCIFHFNLVYKDISSRCCLSPVIRILLLAAFLFVYLADLVCGWMVYAALAHESTALKQGMSKIIAVYVLSMLQWTRQVIGWIMGIPGGLKLNTPLNHYIGKELLVILDLWQYFYSDFIAMYLDSILMILLLLLLFGLTIFLTALHDFLKFLHLSLTCFFVFTSRTVRLQVSMLKSLARLFMGSKWNVLRKRVDSCDYDTNQLLVGTILFTVLLFLLPTTGIYFTLFLILRLIQFGIQLVLKVTTVMLNRSTISATSYLCFIINEDPLTCLKLNMKPGCVNNCYKKVPEIKFVLNGKNYIAHEIRSIVKSIPVSVERIDSIEGSLSFHYGVAKHAMLEFLPKDF